MGRMYFNRTLEDWIGFKINDRTKYDLTISSGLALLASQKVEKKIKRTNFNEKTFSENTNTTLRALNSKKVKNSIFADMTTEA